MGPKEGLDPPEATASRGKEQVLQSQHRRHPGCQAVPMGRMEGTSGEGIGEASGETPA